MPDQREKLIQNLIEDGYLKTPRIIEAFRVIDRADFVLDEYKPEAYGNYPLPIGKGQTISQPLTVAFMLELLNPKPGEKILDIGSGSGWTSALLAYCVSQKNRIQPPGLVFGIERIESLCEFGKTNVNKYGFIKDGAVKFFCKDGTEGLSEYAPFDKILAGAAASKEIPKTWREQLKIGGRIVAPIDRSVWLFIKKTAGKWEEKEFSGFAFVPLVADGKAKSKNQPLPRTTLNGKPKTQTGKYQNLNLFKYLLLVSSLGFLISSLVLINEIYFPHTSFNASKEVEIPPGIGSRKIGELLKKEDLIRSKWTFVLYTTLKRQSALLKPGSYTFYSTDNIPKIVQGLVTGSTDEILISIPEGWSVKDIASRLEEEEIIDQEEFLKMAGFPAKDYRKEKKIIPLNPVERGSPLLGGPLKDFSEKFDFLLDKPKNIGLEGYLFPDTYRFFKSSTPEDIILKMLNNFDKKFTFDLREEITKQSKTIFQIVTMASLIEKEVYKEKDRAIVSGILWKRIEIGMPLQVDATIIYLTGRKSTQVSIEETKIDSPYNTYKFAKLPLGPISNPGINSIKAAVYPQTTNYLYYLSTPTGETIFSKTLQEHNRAKAKYLN